MRHDSTATSAGSEENSSHSQQGSQAPQALLSSASPAAVSTSTSSGLEHDEPTVDKLLAAVPDTSSDDETSWEIEAIVNHRMSDPQTHRVGGSSKPVMLYLVKWVGDDTLTWEPKEAFNDKDTLKEYWHHLEGAVSSRAGP